jgi:hypothetical protein
MILAGYPCGHGWMYLYTCTVYIVLGGGVSYLPERYIRRISYLPERLVYWYHVNTCTLVISMVTVTMT